MVEGVGLRCHGRERETHTPTPLPPQAQLEQALAELGSAHEELAAKAAEAQVGSWAVAVGLGRGSGLLRWCWAGIA